MTSRSVISVSDAIALANGVLGGIPELWVEGEVSNLSRPSSGHLYFTVKDPGAQLQVVMFSFSARQLRFRIENGQKLILRGRLLIYETQGRFQLKAEHAEPAGIGALQLAFEQLKKTLAAEGLFDEARKKKIPMLPRHIAVVTSPTGAAIRDVLSVLGRRFEGLSIQIYPVRVQGTTAAAELARAIGHLSRWRMHDVILICRGGGSIEDLWPFNEEIVARAIAACPIPTISGVGHETDSTICDFVADVRAATPSAAAETVIKAKDEIAFRLDSAATHVAEIIDRKVSFYRSELRHSASSEGLGKVPLRIERTRQRLDRRRSSLHQSLGAQARMLRARLQAADEPLRRLPARLAITEKLRVVALVEAHAFQATRRRVERQRAALAAAAGHLEAVSPLSVLSRGYAIAYALRGRKRPILDAAAVSIGDPVEVQLRRGSIECTVDARTLGVESLFSSARGDGGFKHESRDDKMPDNNSEDDDGTRTRE